MLSSKKEMGNHHTLIRDAYPRLVRKKIRTRRTIGLTGAFAKGKNI